MIEHTMTYEDFDGVEVTETFCFHLSKTEIIELEVGFEGGVLEAMKQMIAAKDAKSLFAEFKKILLLSYGVRSEDGKRFIKTEQLKTEFSQTPAFDELYVKLATDDVFAADFMIGMLPRDFARAVEANPEIMDQLKTELAPPPPPPAVVPTETTES